MGTYDEHGKHQHRRGSHESISVWRESAKEPLSFGPLRENLKADVCVVGAVIAGLTTAYLLQKEGKSVVVVDAWGLAAGETSRTTAHLTGSAGYLIALR